MEKAIEIKNLCKNYPSFRLDNVSFSLPKGYIMGLIGANGRGKSTSIGILLGLVKADSGTCLINGTPMAEKSKKEKEQIGVVLDECNFPETLNYVQINKFMKHIYSNWESEKFTAMCEKYHLPPKDKVMKYSKGMKMKLSIATAMCHGAKVLIMDEPTGGLDPVVRDEILDMLLDFVQDEENSVLISSHIISDLEKVCDYITFIRDGKVVFSDEKDVLTQYYGILHCTNSEFDRIDKSAVISARGNSFGTDALVWRDKVPEGYIVDKANIEDIMLYYIKEDRQ
ncbi:MAG: ABC transporter ATP-binding protein [Oscillospiraceae bacterium]|nr:ABC transporter ATP-binding protein [Oscillospiraceae bacterium]